MRSDARIATQQRDEEFVRALLLLARDRLGAAPHPMEKQRAQRFRPAEKS